MKIGFSSSDVNFIVTFKNHNTSFIKIIYFEIKRGTDPFFHENMSLCPTITIKNSHFSPCTLVGNTFRLSIRKIAYLEVKILFYP